MTPGLRTHHSASLRVAVPTGLPEEMQSQVCELISVRSDSPRKGHATALMWTVCAEADREWITLMICPRKFDDGMDDEKLVPWYEKFGFVVFQQEPVMLMARSPQRPLVRVH